MKSTLLKAARVIQDGTKLVPLINLPGGKNKQGQWAICVADQDLDSVRTAIAQGTVPDIQAAIACITPAGTCAFFNVELRNFGGWCAPQIFEELEESFDLPDSVPLVGLDGNPVKSKHPVKGVVFVDSQGKPFAAPTADKPKPLRFNLTNFLSERGSYSEDGRVWKFTVGETEYVGHLYYVGTDNEMRIFGMVAYVMLTEKAPEKVICGEAVALVPQLVAGLAS